VGHINACLGLAEQLRGRGHSVVFATPNDWNGRFQSKGFIEECYWTPDPERENKDRGKYNYDKFGELVAKLAPSLAMTSKEQITHLLLPMCDLTLSQMKYCEPRLREIVATVKPDAIIIDWFIHSPSFTASGELLRLVLSIFLQYVCLSICQDLCVFPCSSKAESVMDDSWLKCKCV
jgi:UDP:flavonoid glycosyltransferase YjiC (YdhE family)